MVTVRTKDPVFPEEHVKTSCAATHLEMLSGFFRKQNVQETEKFLTLLIYLSLRTLLSFPKNTGEVLFTAGREILA